MRTEHLGKFPGNTISTYVFFVVTSTGCVLVSAIGHVLGSRISCPLPKGHISVDYDDHGGILRHRVRDREPFRMAIYNVISPNLTSNIWWMGPYTALYVFMAIEFTFLVLNKPDCHHIGLWAFVRVLQPTVIWARIRNAAWKRVLVRPYMPIYFIASAMMSGAATINIFTWLAYKTNGQKMDAAMKRHSK